MDDETDEELVVVRSHRVSQMPEPAVPSTEMPCDVCGARVWVADALAGELRESMPEAELRARCLQCGTDDVETHMLPSQVDALMAEGVEPTEIASVMALTMICGDRTLVETADAVLVDPCLQQEYRAALRVATAEVTKILRRN